MRKNCKTHRKYPANSCPVCEQALKASIKKILKN